LSSGEPESAAPMRDDLLHGVRRLERLLAIGFSEQLAAKRAHAGLEDPAFAAILRRTQSWSAAGPLKLAVVRETSQSEPTIKRRINRLVECEALEVRGGGPTTEDRSTGLFG
jgi:hypothetical protein